jgi:hypothetical protein
MSTSEAPNVTYRFVVTATIDGHTAPLCIEGTAINEIRRAVRLLDTNGMLSTTPAHSTDEPPRCPVHNRPMKSSKKPGAWYCSAKVGDGYCTEKVG